MGKRRLGGVLEAIERGPLRSPLFHWMCEHHDEIAAAAAGKRLSWDALCARFATLGLTDRNGKAASSETARKTWRRAKAEVAQRRKDRAKAEAALFPTLRPIPTRQVRQPAPRAESVAKPPIAEPPRPSTRQQPLPTNETQPSADMPEDVRARLAALDSRLQGEDRWLGPPLKRKQQPQ